MKGNYQSLEDLAREIERIERTKQDYLAPQSKISMIEDETLSISDVGSFSISDVSHLQISERLGIPKKYYDAMMSIPGLRTQNVNAWLNNSPSVKRFVRTLDGKSRAILSDRFVPFDNYMLLNSFLPVLHEFKNIKIRSAALSEKRMYLQIVFPEIEGEVKKGDVVQSGIILTNSETGCGSVDVSSMIWRLVCSNGMIGQSVLSKHHVGRKINSDFEDMDIFQNDTRKAEIDAFKLRIRDTIKYAISESAFSETLKKLKESAEDVIENPILAVENITKRYGFSNKEEEAIGINFFNEKENTRWGFANSITALAKTIENYDRQYEVESIGNEIISLNKKEWNEIIAA